MNAREIAKRHLASGDALGWFEELYGEANGDASIIPWADLTPNPNLIEWLDSSRIEGTGKSALKVGCGLGDDAEELARRGFDTTGFDISNTAIAWCRRRFPRSPVSYLARDLFKAPGEWEGRFDLVLESYTLQVLPSGLGKEAMRAIRRFVRGGGLLLVIARGRDPDDEEGKMPWPLLRAELKEFEANGLQETGFEDYRDREYPPVRRFRAVYRKE